jgi:hypothetical protein
MGGKILIDCEKTGYSANIEFLTKVRFCYVEAKIQLGFLLIKAQ